MRLKINTDIKSIMLNRVEIQRKAKNLFVMLTHAKEC